MSQKVALSVNHSRRPDPAHIFAPDNESITAIITATHIRGSSIKCWGAELTLNPDGTYELALHGDLCEPTGTTEVEVLGRITGTLCVKPEKPVPSAGRGVPGA